MKILIAGKKDISGKPAAFSPILLVLPLLLLSLLFSTACKRSCGPEGAGSVYPDLSDGLSEDGPFAVAKIVDGDTIWVGVGSGKKKIRFLNIDTPETGGEKKHAFGFEAKEFVKNMLDGKKVYLESDPESSDIDKYGRLLRYVITPKGLNANIEIVRQGWSAYYVKYGKSSLYHVEFTQAEKEARKSNIGIWADQIFLSGGYLKNARGK
ncbi:MAG: thermonuclease family protein [Pseudomonadota bacterium]